MPRPAKPVKQLRQQYSLLLNRGRELISRHLERGEDFVRLVEDAQHWEAECRLLVQNTFSDSTPEFDRLPPAPVTGDIARDQSSFNRDLAALLRQLEVVEDQLATRKSGCLGLF